MANAIPINSPIASQEVSDAKQPEAAPAVVIPAEVQAMIQAAVAAALAAERAKASNLPVQEPLVIPDNLPKGFAVPKGAKRITVDERGTVRVDL